MDFVNKAADFALVAHHGMVYGGHTYFEGHLSPVAFQAEIIARGCGLTERNIAIVQATAYLHDTVEDTNTVVDDIRRIDGMPHEVANNVHVLTKNSCVVYSDYLAMITYCNREVIIVKLADSLINFRQCMYDGDLNHAKKYANNIQLLTYALEKENVKQNKNRN